VSEQPEQAELEGEQPERPSPDPDALKAARERDEAAAELEAEGAGEGEAPAEPTDEQLLALLPPELQAAIAAGELDPDQVLAATREAVASGALDATPAGEPEPDPLAEARDEYLGKVRAVLGDEAEVVPCEHCQGRGFNPLELPADHYHERCPDCDGWGNVLSGSRVESQRVLPCNGCNGSGHRPLLHAAEAPVVPPAQVPLAPVFVPAPPPLEPANTPPPPVVG
jgi:hypothetical protein